MTTLADYQGQVADLLHDPTNANWSLPQLNNYINEARKQLVMDTGCLRSLQQTYVTTGVEQYQFGQVSGASILAGGTGYTTPTIAFSGGGGSGVAATLGVSGGAVNTITFTSYGSGYTSVPSYVITGVGSGAVIDIGIINGNTYDILGLSMISGGVGGSQRYPLQFRAFSVMSAWLRQWVSTTNRRQPVVWSAYGDTSIFVGPTPDQTYPMEMDSIILPTALADTVTADPIPPVAQDPIKFYAASLAKFNNQSYGESETLHQKYRERLLEVAGAYQRRVPNIYGA